MHNARLHAARQSLLARRVKYGRLETENVQIPNQMRIELFYLVKYYVVLINVVKTIMV